MIEIHIKVGMFIIFIGLYLCNKKRCEGAMMSGDGERGDSMTFLGWGDSNWQESVMMVLFFPGKGGGVGRKVSCNRIWWSHN